MLGDDTTERRLRLLHTEFTQHVKTGPPGDGRSSRPVAAPAPIDLGVLDYMTAAVTEVEQHTRASAPTAGRFTGEATRVYDWARERTADHEPEQQQALEAIIYRQGLEHALAMGHTIAIRTHPCPACGCYGLLWSEAGQYAACINQHCADEHGITRTWSLAHLAQQHIARQESARTRAT